MSRGPEVLAPAGSMDALRAAVECGADAVYLGAGHFNARRNARNFSEEELAEAIEYCHVRGVKVHLTLNTLVSDEELPLAIDLIALPTRKSWKRVSRTWALPPSPAPPHRRWNSMLRPRWRS